MKHLKLLILACGGIALGCYIALGLSFEANATDTIILLAAFALPIAMGLLMLIQPPAQAWQGAVALAGFGTAAVRMRIWDVLANFDAATVSKKQATLVVAVIAGVLISFFAMIRPENKLD